MAAWFVYLSGNYFRSVSAFERFLQIVKAERVLLLLGWRPEALAPVCLLTIENDIEPDYAVRLLSFNGLYPKPPVFLEKWPWPVHINYF